MIKYQFIFIFTNRYSKSLSKIYHRSIQTTILSKNWSKYFEKIETNIFDGKNNNKINRQRPNNLKYIQYENIYAYHIVKKSLLENHMNEFEKQKQSKTFDFDVKQFLNSNDKNVANIANDHISKMNLDEIIEFMQALYSNLPIYLKENEWNRAFLESSFSQIWKNLDSILINKITNGDWPYDDNKYKYLLISHIWFKIGLAQHILFNKCLIDKLLADKNLEKITALYLMFLVNLVRHSITNEQRNSMIVKITSFLENNDNQLNVDQLSVIGIGFFKTQTRMPFELLRLFIGKCSDQLSQQYTIRSTISIAAIIKIIRFSLETIEFNRQKLRQQLNDFVEILGNHPGNFLDSEICLTHLILMLNSILLIDKQFYRQIFDKMIRNLSSFRIKDIERILFCMANVRFQCSERQLRYLENYLYNNDESRLYANCTFNIVLFMYMIDYEPKKLLKLCMNEKMINNALTLSSNNASLSTQLLTLDQILKLRHKKSLLKADNVKNLQLSLSYLFDNVNTQKGRFIQLIYDTLKKELKSNNDEGIKLMYLLPFITYPFIVILNKKLLDFISKLQDKTSADRILCPFDDSIAYSNEFTRRKFFHNQNVLFPLMEKDYTIGSSLRGSIHLTRTLLVQLGFNVISIDHKTFRLENDEKNRKQLLMKIVKKHIQINNKTI